jgi:Domain of unknown function (DUF4190)/Septum formation
VGLRFNPPPNWPPPPPGFVPPPRWQPDPAWPPLPPGWQLWVPDDSDPDGPADYADRAGGPDGFTTGPGDPPSGPQDFTVGSDDFSTGPHDVTGGSADFYGPGDFAAGPGDLATEPGHFAARPGHFAAGPGDLAAGPRDFAAGPGDFSTGPDDFSTGPGDFSTGPGDYTGRPPTALDPLGPPGAYPRGPGASPPPPGPTNGWAIAAFILGLLGGSLLGIIFAIVALRQIGDSRQRGKGLAIAGLVLSIIWGVAVAAFLVLGSSGTPAGQSAIGGSKPSASASSPSASSGGRGSNSQTSVFDLRTGQCFQNPPANQAALGITNVTVVPCTTLHNAQVFVEFPATGSAYPGSTSLKRQANQGCHSRIAANLETSKITSTMSLHFLYPLSASWAAGHRTITCLVVDSKTDLKSSLLRAHPTH